MTESLEAAFAMSLGPGGADDPHLERRYYWTGWKRRHWPAEVVRPGVVFYGFDTRDRLLKVLFKVTRGGSFTYRTKREFANAVERLTGWRPNTAAPHWKTIPGDTDRFNTGLGIRWQVLKRVRIPLSGNFPQLGWLKLNTTAPRPVDLDPWEEFLEGGRQIRRHMQLERSALLRERAKALWRQRLGKLRCLVCGFDFQRVYGIEFIEMHHDQPLAAFKGPTGVTPQELKPLCANCHRIIHAEKPFLSIRALRTKLAAAR